MAVYERKKKESTSEFTYSVLKRKIINLELKPAEKISEKEIANLLQVSRTPVREAFLQLAQEDLLEVYPQIGTVVSKIDLRRVEESRFIRERMEVALVQEACKEFSEQYRYQMEMNLNMQDFCVEKKDYTQLFKLDEEFHKLLFYGCDKAWTWQIVQKTNNHFNRIRVLRLLTSLDWNVLVSQHRLLYELITEKSEFEAAKVMEDHLRLVMFEKTTVKNEYPEYFK